MTTNPYAEAIEAAAWAVAWLNELDGRAAAEDAVDAAIPVLLAPIRALAGEDDPLRGPVTTNATLRRVLDAIEAGATSEGWRDA